MNPISHGVWRIRAIVVNARPVRADDEFILLISSGDHLSIEPAGIRFTISQATSHSAILESQSQVFFADFYVKGEQLVLNLSRPSFSEKVSLVADLDAAATLCHA